MRPVVHAALWVAGQGFTCTGAARCGATDLPVPNNNTTIFEELIAAARGVAGIIVGDRRAPANFDFSQRGLVGSFIAFIVATVFSAYLTVFTGSGGDSLSPGRVLVIAMFLFAVQMGFSALVLRQMKRLDGFVPYLVADNWASFFLTAISSILTLFGLGGDIVLLIVGVVILVIDVNIARLVVTLRPWQIAMFIVAQMVGVSIALIFIGTVFSLPAGLLSPAS
jgi:hypothetical protein